MGVYSQIFYRILNLYYFYYFFVCVCVYVWRYVQACMYMWAKRPEINPAFLILSPPYFPRQGLSLNPKVCPFQVCTEVASIYMGYGDQIQVPTVAQITSYQLSHLHSP